MLKRETHLPEGFTQDETEGYFMLANTDVAKAITSRLTGSQLRLWLYLMMTDTFADRSADGERIYHLIPSPIEIAGKIGASPRTVEKDMKLLRDLKLYDYRVTEWQGHNSSAERARAESERLKRARNDKKELKSAPSKDGYLAANSVKQPETALNNRQSGCSTANPVISPSHIYKDHARDHTFQTNTDFNQTGRDSAATSIEAESFEVKVFESKLHLLEKEQDLTQPDALEANEFEKDKFSASLGLPSEPGWKLLTTQATPGTQQTAHEASALHDGDVLDLEVMKEIEFIAYDWRQRPWMASANKFKPEMIQAVWRCNPNWYSLEGSNTPNLKKICDRLRKLDAQLRKLDTDALSAYSELQNYWSCAQAIANPEVEIAFAQVAFTAKQQQLYAYYAQALNQHT